EPTVRFEHCGGCGTNGRWSARTRAPSHHPIRAGAKVNGPSGPDNNIVLGIETSNTIPQAPLVNRRLSTAVWVSTAVQVDGERSSPPTASSAIPSFSWDDSMRNRAKHGLASHTATVGPEKSPVPRIPDRDDSFEVLASRFLLLRATVNRRTRRRAALRRAEEIR